MKQSIDEIIDRIQNQSQQAVSPEEEKELRMWDAGRKLAGIVNFPGWEVVLEFLKSYSTMETETLLNTPPGSDAVIPNQAMAWAADRIYYRFLADVEAALTTAQKPPAVFSSIHQEAPPESL